jgi:hypothetical protein
MSEDEYYEVRVSYGNITPTRYKAKLDEGIIYQYAYHPDWGEWRIISIKFSKWRFRTVEAVEQYLNRELKASLIDQVANGIWNSKVKSELLALLTISDIKVKNAEVRMGWLYA